MKTCRIMVAVLCAFPSSVMAQSFLFSGIQSISDAGAGQTVSRGANASAQNPANLSFSQTVESYADVSMMSMKYTYAHTNYDPVDIKQNAPPVNMGVTLPLSKQWSFGALVTPRSAPGAKPIEISSVPTFAGAGYALYDLQVEQGGLNTALGIGGRPISALPLSLGVSFIYGQETQSIKAFAVEADHSHPSMDSRYQGSSRQALVGVRGDVATLGLSLAASYKTAAVRQYKGDIASTLSDNVYVSFDGAAYEPAVAGAGVEGKWSSVGSFFEYRREMYHAGRTTAYRGLPYSSHERDYLDTNNYVLGGRWWVDDSHIVSIAYARYGANTGDGTRIPEVTAATASDGVPDASGVEFGDFDNISRQVIAGGIRSKKSGNDYWMIGGNWQHGTRVVPEGYKGEGWYHLNVINVAVGGSVSF